RDTIVLGPHQTWPWMAHGKRKGIKPGAELSRDGELYAFLRHYRFGLLGRVLTNRDCFGNRAGCRKRRVRCARSAGRGCPHPALEPGATRLIPILRLSDRLLPSRVARWT